MAHLVRLMLVALALQLPAPAWAQEDMSPEERYELGLRHLRRGYYTKALEELNRVRNYHRDDPVSVKAELAIADLYFKKGEYEQARLAYEDFARLHPRNENLDYVVYRIGFSIEKRAPKFAGRDQTLTQQAVNTWTGFETRFPDSEYTDEVEHYLARARGRLAAKEMHIARFYARRDAWRAVAGRTASLLRKYPASEEVPEALALHGEALHAIGEVEAAREARERLAADHPDSRQLARLDDALSEPPGQPPEDEIFFRPYRVRGDFSPTPGGT